MPPAAGVLHLPSSAVSQDRWALGPVGCAPQLALRGPGGRGCAFISETPPVSSEWAHPLKPRHLPGTQASRLVLHGPSVAMTLLGKLLQAEPRVRAGPLGSPPKDSLPPKKPENVVKNN